ncbi:MAG: hypothetical protein OXE96_02540 [Gemmatimonadetes bacterium]|nr:hypothetical protein [Gemmatimonadota bacterium]
MASFDIVNYSLRPSKGIQRQIIFDGIRMLKSRLELSDMIYVGLGSIWFSDFVQAHKSLDIRRMVSIEADDTGYCRARFNKPYATVQVRHGHSSAVLAELHDDDDCQAHPWVVWLDYDGRLSEAMVGDIRAVIERSPSDTILLTTFKARATSYGRPEQRKERLRDLLGDVVPDDLSKAGCKGDRMQETLADLVTDFMKAIGVESARPGGFIPAFRIIYKDTMEMVTVGGIVPAPGNVSSATDVISDERWRCRPQRRIVAPLLTIREAVTLLSLLPRDDELTREQVRVSGFDLEQEQIEAFERYYREYPMFAQIVA